NSGFDNQFLFRLTRVIPGHRRITGFSIFRDIPEDSLRSLPRSKNMPSSTTDGFRQIIIVPENELPTLDIQEKYVSLVSRKEWSSNSTPFFSLWIFL
ncbi:MAG: hypothetical protein JSU58_08500, partial [Dehalococcoidales bacterium]